MPDTIKQKLISLDLSRVADTVTSRLELAKNMGQTLAPVSLGFPDEMSIVLFKGSRNVVKAAMANLPITDTHKPIAFDVTLVNPQVPREDQEAFKTEITEAFANAAKGRDGAPPANTLRSVQIVNNPALNKFERVAKSHTDALMAQKAGAATGRAV